MSMCARVMPSPTPLDSIPYKKVDGDLPKIPKPQPRPKGAADGLRLGEPILSHY